MFFFFFFEDDVIDLIESSLSKDESLENGELQLDFGYDFFLPKGCKKLGFPAKTTLLIKRRLVPGALSIFAQDAKKLYDQRGIGLYVIIYDEAFPEMKNWNLLPELPGRVRLISGDELIQKAGKNEAKDTKDWRIERDKRLERAWKEIHFSPNTLFIGAGLSCSLGVPDWKGLLEGLAKGISLTKDDMTGLMKDSNDNYLLAARYIQYAANEQKKEMVSELRSILYTKRKHSRNFIDSVTGLLTKRPFEEVITYNYDNFLEVELEAKGKRCQSIDCQNRRIKNYFPVLHVHGMVHPEDLTFDTNVVFSEERYHELYRDSYHWANVAQLYALTHTTCIFVGLSMNDPSLRRLLDIAAKQGSGNVEHYAFLCRDKFVNHRKAEEVFSQMGVGIIWCENKYDVPVQIARLYEEVDT